MQSAWKAPLTSPATVTTLLSVGAKVDNVDVAGANCLHHAASTGIVEAIDLLLEAGADLNASDVYGDTPLFKALAEHRTEASRFLLENGADAQHLDWRGDSALHLVAADNYPALARLLLDEGKVDINIRGHWGRTPAARALLQGHQNAFEVFVSRSEMDMNAVDDFGNTLLHMAVRGDYLKNVRRLWLKGNDSLDVDAKNRLGQTPLIMSAMRKSQNIASFLLNESFASPNISDVKGNTPLHWAARSDLFNLTVALISYHGVDVNATNLNGETSVHCAIRVGAAEIVGFLLNNGAVLPANDRVMKLLLSEAMMSVLVEVGGGHLQQVLDHFNKQS